MNESDNIWNKYGVYQNMNKNKKSNAKVNVGKPDKELLEKEQIVHIKAGLKQAKEKQFASDEEVKKVFDKWAK